ncbi:MAG: hypothetical protein ACJLTB_19810 [Algoriphagus aquaeductus]|uniref:hypothetical protein n=1 Tax=Algoriphagus aquaeductus TaxID=475299 RepID=UPI00387941FB
MDKWLIRLAKKLIILLVFGLGFSGCSLLERKEYSYTFEEIAENEIVVDFTKINPGSWDTLLLIPPYTTSERIGVGYSDSDYLEQVALADWIIVTAFLEKGDMKGYASCTRIPVDLGLVLEDEDSVLVKKIPRTEAVFRFIKGEDGIYQLKK